MDLKDSDRLKAKLFAINMRVQELEQECSQAQTRVSHLEAQLEDARLAQLVGGEAGDPGEIGPELERSRGRLEGRQELLDTVKKSQWKARVAYTFQQAKERQAERKQKEAEQPDGDAAAAG